MVNTSFCSDLATNFSLFTYGFEALDDSVCMSASPCKCFFVTSVIVAAVSWATGLIPRLMISPLSSVTEVSKLFRFLRVVPSLFRLQDSYFSIIFAM